MLNLFELAGLELQREGKNPNNLKDLVKRVIFIRKWLDKHRISIANKIMAGDNIYHYKNRIKTYSKVC